MTDPYDPYLEEFAAFLEGVYCQDGSTGVNWPNFLELAKAAELWHQAQAPEEEQRVAEATEDMYQQAMREGYTDAATEYNLARHALAQVRRKAAEQAFLDGLANPKTCPAPPWPYICSNCQIKLTPPETHLCPRCALAGHVK